MSTSFANPSNDVQNAVYSAAANYSIDPALLFAIGNQESGLNPNAPNGSAGEIGTFQVLPETASGLGFSTSDLGTLQGNANAAAAYLSQLLDQYGGNESQAVAAYNEGPGNLSQYGVLSSTAQYVQNVLAGIQNYSTNNPVQNGGTTTVIPGSNYAGTGSTQTTSGNWLQDIWNQFFTKGANTNPPPETQAQQTENNQIKEVETYASTQIGQIETNILLGGIALAFVAGGFALLAADNKQVQQAVTTAGKAVAA